MIKRSKTYIAIPPGETIKELIECLCLDRDSLAEVLGLTKNFFIKLLEGEEEITPEIAKRLSIYGVSADFLMNLEKIYREKLKLVEEENANNK